MRICIYLPRDMYSFQKLYMLLQKHRGDSVFYVVDLVMGNVFGAATFVLTVVPEAVQLCSSVAISVKPKRPPLFALQHWGHRSDPRGKLR